VTGATGSTGATGTVSAAGDGTLALPGIAFTSQTSTGIYKPAATQIGMVAGGATQLLLSANVLEQRNGTSFQTLRVFNTYTDASNYERLSIFGGASWSILAQAAGTGAARIFTIGTGGAANLIFQVNGTNKWAVDWSTGNFCASTDNTTDIGFNVSSNRPRTIYVGTSVVTPALTVSAPGAFAAGDKYLIVDASGHVHVSALGPAS
jgi:hypothetical protein